MDLRFATKSLQDKEKTQTKDDSSYRTNKANLEKKELEIKAAEVRRKKTQEVIKISFRDYILFI